jgi:hypothetical protein
MNSDTVTLLEEANPISLRTAYVNDDGDVVDFRLMPSLREQQSGRLRPDWSSEFAWLYRHMRSRAEEEELMQGFPCMAKDLKPMAFEGQPRFILRWSESGNSVAIWINGQPWAFIDEETHRGYSKGVITPSNDQPVGNLWDQEIFEKRFGTGIDPQNASST